MSAPAAASARAGSETPAEFLQRVRQHSCYKELRSVIGVVSAVFFLAAAVAGLVGCVILSNDAAGAISYKIPAAIACFVAAPVFVLLGLAFYQSLSLIVDIADIELEANRNK